MSKQSMFVTNKKIVLQIVKKHSFLSIKQLQKVLQDLKYKGLLPNSLPFNDFLSRLISEGLTQYNVSIRGHAKVRYTFNRELDIYKFCNSLEKHSHFSMTSSLNLQGFSDYRANYVFTSKERKKRVEHKNRSLHQKDIDNAFKKEAKRTKAYDKIQNFIVIMLESNYTSSYEIIDFNEFRVSSIDRAFIEIISNVHYFESTKNVIDIFTKIKDKLDIDKIYKIIERFDFVYSYHQIAGYYLEQIGFTKDELLKFHKKKTTLRFYTQKNQKEYSFEPYWGVYV